MHLVSEKKRSYKGIWCFIRYKPCLHKSEDIDVIKLFLLVFFHYVSFWQEHFKAPLFPLFIKHFYSYTRSKFSFSLFNQPLKPIFLIKEGIKCMYPSDKTNFRAKTYFSSLLWSIFYSYTRPRFKFPRYHPPPNPHKNENIDQINLIFQQRIIIYVSFS